MIDNVLTFLNGGLLNLPVWAMLLIFFVLVQATVISVTLYLHRCQAHRGVDIHPIVTHPMRMWLWLTTGMRTQEWVAIHRKHHARCETEEDPHSPQTKGLRTVLLEGAELYADECKNEETIKNYGAGCPDDWLERNVYRHSVFGPTAMLFIDFALFGVAGVAIWAIQMAWIPIMAAGVINGLGHWWGYRNFHTTDTSHNLTPWAFFLGGEELHNNHHAYPSSAKFALRKWEFDLGWSMLRTMQLVGLAKVRRVAPAVDRAPEAFELDKEAMRTLFVHRYTVMRDYARAVIQPTVKTELTKDPYWRKWQGKARKLMAANANFFNEKKQQKLNHILEEQPTLNLIYEYRMKLLTLWEEHKSDPEQMLIAIRQWCAEAEATGVAALQQFAESLGTYRARAIA